VGRDGERQREREKGMNCESWMEIDRWREAVAVPGEGREWLLPRSKIIISRRDNVYFFFLFNS
jgi:hypothetical protein